LKKLGLEIAAIVIVAVLLALLTNNFAAKPLPLIGHKAPIVADNLLDSLAAQVPIATKPVIENTTISKVETQEKTTGKTEKENTKETIKDIASVNKNDNVKTDNVNPDDKSNIEKTVTFAQVKQRLNDPRFFFIDARNAEEFAKGHIGNSVNIFPYEQEVKYMEKIMTLPRDKIFVIYCTGGTCDLSHKVADDMLGAGFKNIFIFTGGWDEWNKQKK